jgi:putative endonuclease
VREQKRYYVYIMASRSLTLYTGVTGSVYRRALQHKAGEIEGFTKKHHIHRLVYYETFKYVSAVVAREKQSKAWTRAKRVIKTMNPTWQDLAEGWGEQAKPPIPRLARDDKAKADDDPKTKDDNSPAGNTSPTNSQELHRKTKIA